MNTESIVKLIQVKCKSEIAVVTSVILILIFVPLFDDSDPTTL